MSSAFCSPRRPLIAVVGATGTGKSQVGDLGPPLCVLPDLDLQLAVALAQRFNGEIINCDVLQMYEGLPIATNKISIEDRRSVPHHLLGCVKLNEEPWTVAKFLTQATQIIDQIRSRGKLPIVVGGTHYYIQSLLFRDALVDGGPEYVSVEEQEKRWPVLGGSSMEMLAELKRVDPVMAQRWHPSEARKIRRSLEIYLTTGRKASEIYEEQRAQRTDTANSGNAEDENAQVTEGGQTDEIHNHVISALRYDSLILWMHASSETLRSRLDNRVEAMLRDGLLPEVESLHRFQLQMQDVKPIDDLTRGIWIAIGYKEFLPYLLGLEAGNVSAKKLERLKLDGIEQTQIRTRQYAKSQTKWIKGKLIIALQREDLTRNLFLLDATDLTKWESKVVPLADQVVTAFLTGSALPESRACSDAADNMLRPVKEQKLRARRCQACNKTMMTEDAWETHLKSKKHKATARCKQRDLEALSSNSELLSLGRDW